ncbi:uncharacterized protein IWZ02DRAFT_454433 [Phyllosticta citriasiana]|uniref:uncharacterized protein n=1 Tax=Phyllosticta citriasiana TaxID=595635 RepID=UPI0030FDA268
MQITILTLSQAPCTALIYSIMGAGFPTQGFPATCTVDRQEGQHQRCFGVSTAFLLCKRHGIMDATMFLFLDREEAHMFRSSCPPQSGLRRCRAQVKNQPVQGINTARYTAFCRGRRHQSPEFTPKKVIFLACLAAGTASFIGASIQTLPHLAAGGGCLSLNCAFQVAPHEPFAVGTSLSSGFGVNPLQHCSMSHRIGRLS